jgi:hypothetical protein
MLSPICLAALVAATAVEPDRLQRADVPALIRWLRWGWTCFSSGGLWKRPERPAPQAEPVR